MPADVHLELRRRRGTAFRFLRGAVVGLLTAGLVEKDLQEPQRFQVVIRNRPGGRVLGRLNAGDNPWDAEAFYDAVCTRAQEQTRDQFLRQYCG